MIQSLYDLLGLVNLSTFQETLIFCFALVLLFFGALCVLNAVLSFFSNLFNVER